MALVIFQCREGGKARLRSRFWSGYGLRLMRGDVEEKNDFSLRNGKVRKLIYGKIFSFILKKSVIQKT